MGRLMVFEGRNQRKWVLGLTHYRKVSQKVTEGFNTYISSFL